MHRTQILLEEWQYERLRSLAERRDRSLSDLIREAVAVYLQPGEVAEGGGLSSIEGIFDDPGATGEDHDRFLYGEPYGS